MGSPGGSELLGCSEAVARSDRRALREHEGRHAIEVERRVAEVALERPGAPHPQVQILLPGVADRAVYLQRGPRGEARGFASRRASRARRRPRARGSPRATECAACRPPAARTRASPSRRRACAGPPGMSRSRGRTARAASRTPPRARAAAPRRRAPARRRRARRGRGRRRAARSRASPDAMQVAAVGVHATLKSRRAGSLAG